MHHVREHRAAAELLGLGPPVRAACRGRVEEDVEVQDHHRLPDLRPKNFKGNNNGLTDISCNLHPPTEHVPKAEARQPASAGSPHAHAKAQFSNVHMRIRDMAPAGMHLLGPAPEDTPRPSTRVAAGHLPTDGAALVQTRRHPEHEDMSAGFEKAQHSTAAVHNGPLEQHYAWPSDA